MECGEGPSRRVPQRWNSRPDQSFACHDEMSAASSADRKKPRPSTDIKSRRNSPPASILSANDAESAEENDRARAPEHGRSRDPEWRRVRPWAIHHDRRRRTNVGHEAGDGVRDRWRSVCSGTASTNRIEPSVSATVDPAGRSTSTTASLTAPSLPGSPGCAARTSTPYGAQMAVTSAIAAASS